MSALAPGSHASAAGSDRIREAPGQARRGSRWTLPVGLFLGVVALVGVGIAAYSLTPIAAPAPPRSLNGATLDPPIVVPPLDLERSDGRAFDVADLRGRVSLVTFGYTSCPDVCPTNLANLAQVLKRLGPQAANVDVYFVTGDPERDSVERLASYTAQFKSRIVGVTGSPDELAQARSVFNVVAQKRPPEPSGAYFVDHTAAVFLVDQTGEARLVYPYGTQPEEEVADVRQLLQ